MRKRAFIYIRVSTREQAEEGYSIGEQEERLTKYCEAMEWQLIKVYIDPGFTVQHGAPRLARNDKGNTERKRRHRSCR